MTEKNRLNKRFDLSRLSENSRMLLQRALEIPSEEYEYRRGAHIDELSARLNNGDVFTFLRLGNHYTLCYLVNNEKKKRDEFRARTFYSERETIKTIYDRVLEEKSR